MSSAGIPVISAACSGVQDFQPRSDQGESGGDLSLGAVGEGHGEAALQRGVDPGGHAQPLRADDHRLFGGAVPDHEARGRWSIGGRRDRSRDFGRRAHGESFAAVVAKTHAHGRSGVAGLPERELVGAQSLVGIRPHEQRRVGVRAHEVPIGLARVDHPLAHRQPEGGVGTGLDLDPGVGLGCRGREGGVDHHQAGPLLQGVLDEVGIGDARLQRVGPDGQDEPAVGPVLGLMLGVLDPEGDRHAHGQVAVEVEAGAVGHAQRGAGAVVRPLLDVTGPRDLPEHVDAFPSPRIPDALELGGDAVEDFLPRGLPELAGPPVAVAHQRCLDAVRPVDQQVIGDPLHTAPRVVDRIGVVRRLLDLDDVAVAHEGELPAGARAVGGAGGPHHPVDGQGADRVVAARQHAVRGSAEGRSCGDGPSYGGRPLEELPAREAHESAVPLPAAPIPAARRRAAAWTAEACRETAGQPGSSALWPGCPQPPQTSELLP